MSTPSVPTVSDLSIPLATNSSVSDEQSKKGSSPSAADEPSEEQLSADLALFLSNPSLKAALADGSLDLASYSSTVEQELEELESQCIGLYQSKSDDIRQLKQELLDCDAVLMGLQEMLFGFQADLGGLSGDIRQLQEKSRSLDVQLRNRRRAKDGLCQFLDKVVIAPQLAQVLLQGPVNTVFLQSVAELERRYQNAHSAVPQEWASDMPPCQTVAGQELQTHVSKLRLVAVARVRDYFWSQMLLLRQAQTNVRMIQLHGLLKYADLYDFLLVAAPEIATELFQAYLDSMSQTLHALFRTYNAQLQPLDSTKTAATRHDVIAIDDAVLRDTLTTKTKKRVDVFCLNNRAKDVLDHESETPKSFSPILAHVAMATGQTYPYERIFRSILGHLVDAVTNEHIFCRMFFKRDAFAPLFHPTVGLLLEQLENYLFTCHDALCLLLLIQVVHSFRRLSHFRKIHSLDSFLDQALHLIWPRLKMVMDAHLRSIKGATAAKLGGVDLHAHYVSRRYAEFTCSILLILQKTNSRTPPALAKIPSTPTVDAMRRGSNESQTKRTEASSGKSAGERLLQDLGTLQEEFVKLLGRLGDEFPTQKRIIFLINNLDQVVCIFQERRVAGNEFNRIVELLMTQRELFVEEELLHSFSKMIAFVQQTETHMAEVDSAQKLEVNAQVVEALVSHFASDWKKSIEQINRNVLSYFSNFRNGMEILKQVLTQLLLYYTRFQDIIRKVWRNKPPAFCQNLVSTTAILAEIKKYALAI